MQWLKLNNFWATFISSLCENTLLSLGVCVLDYLTGASQFSPKSWSGSLEGCHKTHKGGGFYWKFLACSERKVFFYIYSFNDLNGCILQCKHYVIEKVRASNEVIYFQNKFYLILTVLYTESIYILIFGLQFKLSSNWWKFKEV